MTKVHSCHNNSSKHPVVAAPGSIKRSAMDLAGSWLATKELKFAIFLRTFNSLRKGYLTLIRRTATLEKTTFSNIPKEVVLTTETRFALLEKTNFLPRPATLEVKSFSHSMCL